jgi:hypothetical protein
MPRSNGKPATGLARVIRRGVTAQTIQWLPRMASRSWWVGAPRVGFAGLARAERDRMNQGKWGRLETQEN